MDKVLTPRTHVLGISMLLLGILLGYSSRPWWMDAHLASGKVTPTPLASSTSTPDPTMEAQRQL